MVKVAVCDDEETVRNQLLQAIGAWRPEWEVYAFSSGQDLLDAMVQTKFFIYFMDIELGDGNGYYIAKHIREQNPNAVVIFISCHEEYACEAFEVDALRFLKKPYEEEKLKEAIQKAAEIVEQQNVTFSFRRNGEKYQVSLYQVCYVERHQRTLLFHLADRTCLEVYGSLRELERKFSKKLFCRSHQGYLVNLSYIKSIRESIIILETGAQVPLARSRKEKFRDAYMDYCWARKEQVNHESCK